MDVVQDCAKIPAQTQVDKAQECIVKVKERSVLVHLAVLAAFWALQLPAQSLYGFCWRSVVQTQGCRPHIGSLHQGLCVYPLLMAGGSHLCIPGPGGLPEWKAQGGDPPPSHQLSRMSPRRVSPPPLWGSLPQRHTPRGGIREPGIPFPSAAPPGGLTPSFLPHEALETEAISNTFISQHEIKLTGGKGKGGGGRGTLF